MSTTDAQENNQSTTYSSLKPLPFLLSPALVHQRLTLVDQHSLFLSFFLQCCYWTPPYHGEQKIGQADLQKTDERIKRLKKVSM